MTDLSQTRTRIVHTQFKSEDRTPSTFYTAQKEFGVPIPSSSDPPTAAAVADAIVQMHAGPVWLETLYQSADAVDVELVRGPGAVRGLAKGFALSAQLDDAGFVDAVRAQVTSVAREYARTNPAVMLVRHMARIAAEDTLRRRRQPADLRGAIGWQVEATLRDELSPSFVTDYVWDGFDPVVIARERDAAERRGWTPTGAPADAAVHDALLRSHVSAFAAQTAGVLIVQSAFDDPVRVRGLMYDSYVDDWIAYCSRRGFDVSDVHVDAWVVNALARFPALQRLRGLVRAAVEKRADAWPPSEADCVRAIDGLIVKYAESDPHFRRMHWRSYSAGFLFERCLPMLAYVRAHAGHMFVKTAAQAAERVDVRPLTRAGTDSGSGSGSDHRIADDIFHLLYTERQINEFVRKLIANSPFLQDLRAMVVRTVREVATSGERPDMDTAVTWVDTAVRAALASAPTALRWFNWSEVEYAPMLHGAGGGDGERGLLAKPCWFGFPPSVRATTTFETRLLTVDLLRHEVMAKTPRACVVDFAHGTAPLDTQLTMTALVTREFASVAVLGLRNSTADVQPLAVALLECVGARVRWVHLDHVTSFVDAKNARVLSAVGPLPEFLHAPIVEHVYLECSTPAYPTADAAAVLASWRRQALVYRAFPSARVLEIAVTFCMLPAVLAELVSPWVSSGISHFRAVRVLVYDHDRPALAANAEWKWLSAKHLRYGNLDMVNPLVWRQQADELLRRVGVEPRRL